MVLRAQRNYIPPRVLGHKDFKELWLPAFHANGFLFFADKGAIIHKLAHICISILTYTAHTQKDPSRCMHKEMVKFSKCR